MNIKIVKTIPLKRPPTDLLDANGKLYISTKGKRVYFVKPDLSEVKSILFSSQVNSLAKSEKTLFCACSDGKVFGLSEEHKVIYRSFSDDSGSTRCKYNSDTKELYVSTNNKKISVLSEDGILKRSHYCNDTPVIDIDIAYDSSIAGISQLNKTVMIFNPYDTKPRSIKILHGFPEALWFKDETILIGTDSGNILSFSAKTLKKKSFVDLKVSAQSLFVDGDICFAGLANGKMVIIDLTEMKVLLEQDLKGIPVAFNKFDGKIAVAISREPRLGRWGKMSKGSNRLVFLEKLE